MTETITDFIEKDLRILVQQGRDWPDGLTLGALASRYKVSVTPVRLAVQKLIEDQILVKHGNGRLEVHPKACPEEAQRPEEMSVDVIPADPFKVETALTSEIVRLSLLGAEVFLREEATAEQFGIGRTVLRQVFNRLAGKGLIEHLPRRGWRVHPFDEVEMQAYLDVRVILELKALDLSRQHLVQVDLERMLRGNEPSPSSHADRLDNDLHQYLISKAGNRYIKTFFEQHGAYYTYLFAYAAPGANVVNAMARQHRSILSALLAKDWRTARKELAHHIRSQGVVVRRLLQKIKRK